MEESDIDSSMISVFFRLGIMYKTLSTTGINDVLSNFRTPIYKALPVRTDPLRIESLDTSTHQSLRELKITLSVRLDREDFEGDENKEDRGRRLIVREMLSKPLDNSRLRMRNILNDPVKSIELETWMREASDSAESRINLPSLEWSETAGTRTLNS